MKPLIYLASPYSHPNPAVVEQRFQDVSRAAAMMTQDGLMVFCPIAHSHPMAVYGGLTGNWEFWKAIDTEWIERCSELHLLMLPGWNTSTGVNAEVDIALKLGLPIFRRSPEEFGIHA